MFYESIMLLSSTFREWLEPMCIVRNAVFVSPLLHPLRHLVGDGAVETCTIVNYVDEFLVSIFLQVLVHLLAIEHILAEILRWTFYWSNHFNGLFLKSLLYNLESQVCHTTLCLFLLC